MSIQPFTHKHGISAKFFDGAGSTNGRSPAFEAEDPGSNPGPAAKPVSEGEPRGEGGTSVSAAPSPSPTGRRREYKWRTDAHLTADQVRAVHRLHVEAGLSISELGRQMWQRFGYSSPHSCACSLSSLFKRAGLKARGRIEATVAASTTHGRGARADKAAYKRWHRETFGPWPSDHRKEAA